MVIASVEGRWHLGAGEGGRCELGKSLNEIVKIVAESCGDEEPVVDRQGGGAEKPTKLDGEQSVAVQLAAVDDVVERRHLVHVNFEYDDGGYAFLGRTCRPRRFRRRRSATDVFVGKLRFAANQRTYVHIRRRHRVHRQWLASIANRHYWTDQYLLRQGKYRNN